MEFAQLPQGEFLLQQPERIRGAFVESPQPVHGYPHDFLMFGTELVDVVDGHELAPVDGGVRVVGIRLRQVSVGRLGDGRLGVGARETLRRRIRDGRLGGGVFRTLPARAVILGESDIGGGEHIEVGHGDHPTAIITVGLVEHVQLDGGAVDEAGLLAQAAGDRLGEAFLRTQDRPGQLPHPIAGMGHENMQATAGHGAEDRGVDRDRGPRELRELAGIRHALRIVRTRRFGGDRLGNRTAPTDAGLRCCSPQSNSLPPGDESAPAPIPCGSLACDSVRSES